ncbi:transglutaminaseTgpA domain-containing protein [Kitasatospora sp. NPDC057198]|uniref:transglutaminase family protein n=1 Tax=Kitasatospora sp. NPDC057198 TaxID=3346046 RepID=UPI00362F0AC2
MTTRAKLTLCAALATALAALCLSPLFQDSFALAPHGLLMVAVAAGAGAGLRALPLPRALVTPLQLVVVLYVLMLTTVQSSMAFGLLPGPDAVDRISSLLSQGGTDVQDYAIPAPATDGLRLIVVGSVALVAVLVDALAVTYRRAAAAGLPLLALYSVAGGLAESPGGMWLWFLFAAAGYLALLYTEGQDRLTRWGRVFHGTGRSAVALSNGGRRIGVIALTAAVLLPVFVPAVGSGMFGDLGSHSDQAGGGTGDGKDGVRSLNLVVALTANLRSSDDTELLTFSTDSPEADQLYLRIAELSEFNGQEWLTGEQDLQPMPTTVPGPEGLMPNLPTTSVRTNITISDQLSTAWLPMPYPMSWVELPSTANWRFDPVGRTVSGTNGQKSKGLSYSVGSVSVNATAAQLRNAGPAPADITGRYLELPSNLPSVVADTAKDVTRGKNTPYDRAVALQQYFTSGGFTYNTKIDSRTGPDAIAKFLQDKEGFCVHFAATMAAMSRSLGIPARVAIGFTPGSGSGGNRVVRSSNYHAWPELYFNGFGWMRFEPTPNRGTTPLYSLQQTAPSSAPSTAPSSAAPSEQPSAQPSASSSCPPQQHRLGDCGDEQAVVEHQVVETPWWRTWPALVTVLGVLVVLAVLSFPMVWRSRLRRRRLGTGRRRPGTGGPRLTDEQVLAAWAELVDSAWDLGIPPDEARTPRNAVRRLAEDVRLDPDSAAAAGRVALATERVMYARESDAPPQLDADVRTAREALMVRATRVRRLRALLLPASAVRLWWRAQDRAAARRERTAERVAAVRAALAKPFRRRKKQG